jgi:hypothetical protein
MDFTSSIRCHPGALEHEVLPYSFDKSFARESISDGQEKPCTSTKCQLENCRVRSLNTPEQFVYDNSLVTVPPSPYSSDLAPSDLWLFGHIKAYFADCVFNDVDEILKVVLEFYLRFIPLNCSFFSPLDRMGEMGLGQQWRILSRANNIA